MGNSQTGKLRRNFHQACWDEPMIYEMSSPGVRGILVPEAEQEIKDKAGDVTKKIPEFMRREEESDLPEVSQKHVLMHYKHLAQETMGSNITNDISEGTCTMKYNPRINEVLVKEPKFSELHPLQDEDTVQGILEIYYRMEQMFCEITGMDRATFQPGGGNHAVYNAASVVRAYHEANGEGEQRDEIITTIYSHPCNAASPDTAGYKVITIYPDESGFPDIEAIREAASERTAAIFMTNPEDIGLYNPRADEIVKIIKDVGGLCYYDQANANAFLGIARARDAGFDMCHFNVHKTLGTPHGCSGPGNGAFACTEELAKFLPKPTVEYDGSKYYLNYNRPNSYGKVRDFYGTAGVVLRAYAWIRAMGAEGLRETSEVSVINNNYLYEKLIKEIPDLDYCYSDNGHRRQEQVRYTWEKLKEKTGIGTTEIHDRVADYGVQHYWESHEPWVIPEPMTLEPCETYSKDDLDEYIELLKQITKEAYENPDMLKNAPHRAATAKRNDESSLNDPDKWALTWRAYLRKHGKN
ncbi:aminomethyl-transferring glycine dehydrogenase subunit GcvPB [Natranaerobius trueperi]|uniref:Glycine dehydrogenase subunit 2 n=1 Tax=Natranaerobius trueperi TaxID=759412 RepID=A0A226BX12_9FIRM|nr:aminomethyl-transferring glycine dehydrogenase subunit GcvPB [Natranaerobius trueperi]OWZ82729.1 glycine dehydrogenase subunit 2 [Natranaerobius trueperi]